MSNIDEIYAKYGGKMNLELDEADVRDASKDYLQFKKEMMPSFSRYEQYCQSLGNFLRINISQKDADKVKRQLDIAHLDVEPSQTVGFAVISTVLVFFLGLALTIGLLFLTGEFSLLFLFLVFIACFFVFYYYYSMPSRLANKWRLKASSQMVPCILYVVVYMRHTSNLERAIAFAAKHLEAPLSLDFKKVFWDVETGKYHTIKESLDAYLETWRDYGMEFIEAFHLIESSLYEPDDTRRILTLEKSLQVILDGVYEKMLKFSRDIRSPLTNVYMLGIVLPTLALAILPLAATLLQGAIKWHHVFVLFNVIVPFFVFYLTSEIMLKRPGGYGETELLEKNPDYYKYKSNKPYIIAGLVALPLLIIGFLPLIFQFTPLASYLGLQKDYAFSQIGLGFMKSSMFFDFQSYEGGTVGPFGIGAIFLSLCIPLAIGLFFMIAYKMKTSELIKAREDSKELEDEFTGSLFQLGNRLGDGMPAEMAFGRIAESSKGLKTENFFRIVNLNIQQQGMSVENAIFDSRRGALIYYPSQLISTSMRILVESAKKGLEIAARSLMSISDYVKNIHKINERLRDLLAEVISDMRSNMTFLAPLLAGIVVGLAAMITLILANLEKIMNSGAGGDVSIGGIASVGNLTSLFKLETMIPTYYLQIAIGIYIIQIVFILTETLVTVDAGEDKLKTTYDIGINLGRGMILYVVVAFITILALSILATVTLGGIIN